MRPVQRSTTNVAVTPETIVDGRWTRHYVERLLTGRRVHYWITDEAVRRAHTRIDEASGASSTVEIRTLVHIACSVRGVDGIEQGNRSARLPGEYPVQRPA